MKPEMGRTLAIVCRRADGLSGAAAMISEHSRRLRERGWSVDVYAQRCDRKTLSSAGARARWVPGWPWGSYFKRRLFAALSGRWVKRGGYDLVHGYGDGFSQDILSLHNCVHAAHEAIYGSPLPGDSGVGRLHAAILSGGGFSKLIANSRLMKEDVMRRFGVAEEKINVIYPGYDSRRFSEALRRRRRSAARRELGYGDSELLFGLITSGDFVKRGVAVFLRALGALARRKVPFKALVAGKEAKLDSYLKMADQEGIASKIRFFPPAAQVEKYYYALDVYVHPAHFEEFGISVLEAFACGLPVLANQRVGAGEIMTGEARRFLPELSDPEILARHMEELAKDAGLRERLGVLGAVAARDKTWDDNFDATYAVYENLLALRQ